MGNNNKSPSKNEGDKEMGNGKELLVLDIIPSKATMQFLVELKKIKCLAEAGITYIEVKRDDLYERNYSSKPVLLICNNISRIQSDLKEIKYLQCRSGKLILLVLHCVKKNQLPSIELSDFLKDDLPSINEIVEMGYDCHAGKDERIYRCSLNDDALGVIKNITFERSRFEVDLVVKLRCGNNFKDKTIDMEALKLASLAINQCTNQNKTCFVVLGVGDNTANENENRSVSAFVNSFDMYKSRLIEALHDSGVNAAYPVSVKITEQFNKISKVEIIDVKKLIEDKYVPVLHGLKGCTIVHEDKFISALPASVWVHETKCFPPE